MSPPRAIVFDLDGTLFDSRADIVAAVGRALKLCGRPPIDPDVILRYVGDGARMLCARAIGLPVGHPEVTLLSDAYVSCYREHPADHTTWLPQVRETLEVLAPTYKLAICTNKPRTVTEALLEAVQATNLFVTLVAGDDMPEKKPDPKPVREIASRLGLATEQIVMVGDGPQDVLAGRNAGVRTVGVVGPIVPAAQLRAAGPDALLSTMAALPDVLQRW